jgi:quercetin dioxygenase-like cupin family protein
MPTPRARLHRWDEIALEKITEMVSRKVVSGEREMLAQTYLKRGALVPMHAHDSEQMTYVLQGGLRFLVAGEELTVREGEVLHIPPGVSHQAEALEDTLQLDVFSPIRTEWLEGPDGPEGGGGGWYRQGRRRVSESAGPSRLPGRRCTRRTGAGAGSSST